MATTTMKLGIVACRRARASVAETFEHLSNLADVPREKLADMSARDFVQAVARKHVACARQTVRP